MNRQHDSPDKSIKEVSGTVAQGGNAEVHDRTGLYIAILALVISALCLGLFLMQTFLMPQVIDAKVQAGIAKAEESANTAKTNARLALEKQEEWKSRVEVLEDRSSRKEH